MNQDLLSRLGYQGYFYSIGMEHIVPKDFRRCRQGVSDCLEFLYCVSGEEEIAVNGKSYTILPGTVRITPAIDSYGEEIYVKTLKETVFFDIGYITKNPFTTETIILDASGNPKVHDLFVKLYKISTGKYENWYFDVMSVFWLLLKELRIVMNKTVNKAEQLDKKLKPAMEYIHNHYYETGFMFSELPGLCGFKNNYFHKIFQQRYDTTPAKYVTNLRMQLATDYLITGRYSVAEIAENTGYESGAYFSRVFKNFYGVSPSKYVNIKSWAWADYI